MGIHDPFSASEWDITGQQQAEELYRGTPPEGTGDVQGLAGGGSAGVNKNHSCQETRLFFVTIYLILALHSLSAHAVVHQDHFLQLLSRTLIGH
jgi:hypothetical protein